MHEELWANVEYKLQYAEFHINRMRQSLQPPVRTQFTAALQSSGALIDNDWQLSFYPHFDAFLSCTRSVVFIIVCCFGHDLDKRVAAWFKGLSPDEKLRRDQFTKEFKSVRVAFDDHFLSGTRNTSVHRGGHAPVEVELIGFWGVRYGGSPTNRLPSHDVRPSDGSHMGWLGTAFPIRPTESDFNIDGRNPFQASNEYLAYAKDLTYSAQRISEKVHGGSTLTPPPVS
jgi:hypothetical protein